MAYIPFLHNAYFTAKVGIGTAGTNGVLNVEGAGASGVPVLDIINTTASTFNHSAEIMTPNMTTGQNNILVIGREGNTKNSGYIGYKYSGTEASNDNLLTFGHWGSDNLMNIDGLGNVGIGTESPDAKLEVGAAVNVAPKIRLTLDDSGSSIGLDQEYGGIQWKGNDGQGDGVRADIRVFGEGTSGETYMTFGTMLAGTSASTNAVEKMRIASDGAIKFNTYGAGTLVSDASGNITVSSGGGEGGPYLPLIGGIMTGTITSTASTAIIMDGADSAEGIRMTADASTDYPIFLRSTNPASNETSPWIYREAVDAWGIWHNNPINSFDFTRSTTTGIEQNVGGTTNTVMIRLNNTDGSGIFVGDITSSNGTIGTLNLGNSSYKIEGGSNFGDLRYTAPRHRFYEGAALVMNIDGGNVGIGNTGAIYKLQLGIAGGLADSIRIGSYAVAKDTRQYIGYTRADNGLFESSGTGDTPSTVMSGVAGIRIVNTEGTLASGQADNSVQLLTHTYNGGSAVALHANYNQNIGIGTTIPYAITHINGPTPTGTTGYSDNANSGQLYITSNAGAGTSQLGGRIAFGGIAGNGGGAFTGTRQDSVYGTIEGYKFNATPNNSGGGLSFKTNFNNTGALTERMNIAQDGKVIIPGNVGIGSTTANYQLVVGKSSIATPALMIGGAYYGGPRIQTYGLDADANAWMGLGTDMGVGSYEHSVYYPNHSNGKLTFGTYDGTDYVTKVTLLKNGNFGINKTVPQSKLQVDGGIQMADDTDAAAANKVGTMRYRTGLEAVEVTGVDMIVNGDFATDADWSKGTGWTISGGTANAVAGTASNLSQTAGLTVNALYRMRFTISNYSAGNVQVSAGALLRCTFSGNGIHECYHNCGPNTSFYFVKDANFVGSVDNISVIEVTEEAASYADMCMQTGASTYEWVNIVRNTY